MVIGDAVRDSPERFWREVRDHRVTFISCVPSYLATVLPAAPDGLSLRRLALGGEAFTAELVQQARRRLPGDSSGAATDPAGPSRTLGR